MCLTTSKQRHEDAVYIWDSKIGVSEYVEETLAELEQTVLQ